MSAEGIAERWQSSLDRASLRQALIRKIEQRGHGEVLRATADDISADFGSQAAFRLKGALIAKPNEFPIHGEIALDDVGSGASAEVRLTEAMGFGVKAGSRKKYAAALDDLAAYLRNGLEGPPAQAPSSEDRPPAVPAAAPNPVASEPSVPPPQEPPEMSHPVAATGQPIGDASWRDLVTKWQRLNHGSAIRALEGAVSPGERVVAIVSASTPGAVPKKGLLAFTDARVLFAGGTGGMKASVRVAESKLSVRSLDLSPGSFGMLRLVVHTQTAAHEFVVTRDAEDSLTSIGDWPIGGAADSPAPAQAEVRVTAGSELSAALPPVSPQPSAGAGQQRGRQPAMIVAAIVAVIVVVVIVASAGSNAGSSSLRSCDDFKSASSSDREAFAKKFIDKFDVGSPGPDVLAGLVDVGCGGLAANRANEDSLMFLTASLFDVARDGSPDYYFVSSTQGESDLRRCLRDADC